MYLYRICIFLYVKGTVQRDFRTSVFFIIRINLGHRPKGSNIFRFSYEFADLLEFFNLPGYDTPASQSPWRFIPRQVNKKSAKT